jgi:hypothetical protein
VTNFPGVSLQSWNSALTDFCGSLAPGVCLNSIFELRTFRKLIALHYLNISEKHYETFPHFYIRILRSPNYHCFSQFVQPSYQPHSSQYIPTIHTLKHLYTCVCNCTEKSFRHLFGETRKQEYADIGPRFVYTRRHLNHEHPEYNHETHHSHYTICSIYIKKK